MYGRPLTEYRDEGMEYELSAFMPGLNAPGRACKTLNGAKLKVSFLSTGTGRVMLPGGGLMLFDVRHAEALIVGKGAG